jgi:hypothetical protein
MTRPSLALTAIAAALTLGTMGVRETPKEPAEPLATSDILLAQADSATDADTKSNAEESAKMGKEEGTHSGENQGVTPESDTSKIDQPARANPTTGDH